MVHVNLKRTASIVAVFAASFVVLWILGDQIQIASGPIFGSMIDGAVMLTFFALLAAGYIAFTAALLIFRVSVPIVIVHIAAVSYFLILGFVVLGKSIGVAGVNLNPFQVDLLSSGFALNVMVFIPTGFVLRSILHNSRKVVAIGFCGVFLIEFAQFIFSLGIADVIDVAANTLGIGIGVLFCHLLEKHGQTVVVEHGRFLSVYTGGDRPSQALKRVYLGALGVFVGLGAVCLLAESAHWEDPDAFNPEVLPITEIESKTLTSLITNDEAHSDPVVSPSEIADFTFGGTSSSNAWMEELGNGFYASEGSVDQVISWLDECGNQCFGLTLCCRENVGDVAVVHGLPLVITADTAMAIDGEPADFEEFRQRAFDLYACAMKCEYRLEFGWLFAEKVAIDFAIEDPVDDIALFNYFRYDDYLRAVENEEPFISLSEGDPVTVAGHLVSTTEMADGIAYCTLQFYDKLGSVPVVHSVNVECGESMPDIPEDAESLSDLPVVYEDGRLVLRG